MQVKISSKNSGAGQFTNRVKEFMDYRDLLAMLVRREIVVMYKQSVVGLGWVVFRPLIQMLIFTFVFGYVLNIGDQLGTGVPYALFSFSALVPWTFFSTVLTLTTGSLVGNQQFLNKVYFPRLIIPLAPAIAKLVDLGISFLVLLVMLVIYGYYPTWQYIYLPLLVAIMFFTVMGLGLWLSAIAIQFRDIQHIVNFMVQLVLYATPVIWPLSMLPEYILPYYGFYPMVGVIEGFRAVLLHQEMPWVLIGTGSISAIILMVSGTLFFHSRESKFADIA